MGTEYLLPGQGKTSTSASKAGEGFARELQTQTRPLRQELFDQLLEGLQTGGVGAQIPIIQRATEASATAGSNSIEQLDEQLALSGLAGTPFGQRTRAESQRLSEANTAAVPTNIIQQFLGQAPQLILGSGQQATQGFAAAGSSQAQIRAAQIAAVSQIISSAISGGSQIASAGIGCWIAARLYGENTSHFFLARHYIFRVWKSPFAPLVRWAYRTYGERLSRIPWFVRAVRPLFDRAVARCRKEYD